MSVPKPCKANIFTIEESNEKAPIIPEKAPKDAFNIIYILFFFLGLVHFLPWYFFTTANGYWMYKFRNTTSNDTSSEARSPLQAQFNAILNITLQVSDITCLIVAMLCGHKISVKKRVVGTIGGMLILFVISTILIKIDTDAWQEGFLALSMMLIAAINGLNSFMSLVMYTILANFPPSYLAPYLSGGGLSKMFTSTLQILSLTVGMSTENSALLYFSLGVFIIFFTLVMVLAAFKNNYYVSCMQKFHDGEKEELITICELKTISKKIWASLAIIALYIVALCPAPTTLVVSEFEGASEWNDIYFVPTITFFLASLCDLAGRWIAFRLNSDIKGVTWTIISAIRMVIFIPLLMLCNAQPREHLPVIFPHDYQYIIITIVYSLTGGYMMSICSLNIPRSVQAEELKHGYHIYMVLTGLMMGLFSFSSYISVRLL